MLSEDPDLEEITKEYKILSIIGKGSFSTVFKAEHIITNYIVAIKIVSVKESKWSKKQVNEEKIKSEISILKQLDHPNITKLFDIKQNSKLIFLILEYCESGELMTKIENKSLSLPDTVFLFFQLVKALEYLHERNIVHRDIKPQNILLTSNNILKLSDFGLSIIQNKFELLTTQSGTLLYSAPEKILGQPYAGLPADIWSTGVVLFLMTFGRLPFSDENRERLARKISLGIFDCDEITNGMTIPRKLMNLIQSLLTVNIKQRIKLGDILNHDLFGCIKYKIKANLNIDYSNKKLLYIYCLCNSACFTSNSNISNIVEYSRLVNTVFKELENKGFLNTDLLFHNDLFSDMISLNDNKGKVYKTNLLMLCTIKYRYLLNSQIIKNIRIDESKLYEKGKYSSLFIKGFKTEKSFVDKMSSLFDISFIEESNIKKENKLVISYSIPTDIDKLITVEDNVNKEKSMIIG